MNKFAFSAIALIATVNTANAGWEDVSWTDDMTDKKVLAASIEADNTSGRFMDHQVIRLIVRCKDNKLETIAITDGYVGMSDGKLSYRVNDLPIKTVATGLSTDGKAYFVTGKTQRTLLSSALSGEKLRFTAFDYNGNTSFSSFSGVNENKNAVVAVAKACNVNLVVK